MMIWEVEFVLFLFLFLSAIIALNVKDLLVAVVVLSVFSFIAAQLFVAMGAVDVGFTEAVVGAGVTGILFVIAIFHTTRDTKD